MIISQANLRNLRERLLSVIETWAKEDGTKGRHAQELRNLLAQLHFCKYHPKYIIHYTRTMSECECGEVKEGPLVPFPQREE